MKRWALLVLAACIALALAYLPPRGATPKDAPPFFMSQSAEPTPARRRSQALAEEWRAADGALRLLQQRQRVRALVERSIDRAGPVVVFSGHGAVAPAGARLVDSAMQAAWRELGLGQTKIAVAVVIHLAQPTGAAGQPVPEQERVAYLVPDSTDRTSCLVFLPVGRYWARSILGEQQPQFEFRQLVRSFKAGFGPCGFYAAYGTPAKPVQRWLVARNWDLGLSLEEDDGSLWLTTWVSDPRVSWHWDAVYAYPPTTVGCFAGRPRACRAAVLLGASRDNREPEIPLIMRLDRRWWRTQHLLPGQRYLFDVAREVGRDRFLEFWTSSLPVDTSLATALRQPIGEWTAGWERRFVQPVRLGPAAPLGATLLALLFASVAVSAVALGARRRQVR